MPNDIYKPVTESSLREFYQQIQPYLNADVPVIANKFDKANLYSETERIVGQWVDGKPLYQKTINFGALPNASTKDVTTGLTSVLVHHIFAYGYNSTSGLCILLPNLDVSNPTSGAQINVRDSGATVRVVTGSNMSAITECYFTLQYTKSTDTTISIGADTDYSTTEKVIGTWVDGKPIYQKTIEFNSSTYTDANKRRQFTLGTIDGVDMLVDVKGNYSVADNNYLAGVTFVASDPVQPQYSIYGVVNSSTHKVTTYFASALVQAITSVKGYITVQYTKTTA